MKKLFALLTIALLCATTTYSIAQDKGAQKKDSGYVFTTDLAIPISGIRNQGSSGTCWAFSTTSFLILSPTIGKINCFKVGSKSSRFTEAN